MSSLYNSHGDVGDDSLKLQFKMLTKKKRLSIFRNENLVDETTRRFSLTNQAPNINFDVTLKPNLSIRGDRLRVSKEEKNHTVNLALEPKSDTAKAYFSLPVHVRSRNRNQPQAVVVRHNSDLSRVNSPFTYIETFSTKRRYSLSPQVLIKKARVKIIFLLKF